MRVLVLTPYLFGTAPGPRTSIELWERVLATEGITFEYAPFENERLHEIIYAQGRQREKAAEMLAGLGRRLALMRRLDEFDAVLVYREAALLGPAVIERWIANRGKPIIYQLDDPLYVPYKSQSNGYLSYLKFFGKVKSIIRMSSVVIVNSPQHRWFAAPLNGNVWEIPSVIDDREYTFSTRTARTGPKVCVGWSGSITTTGNLLVVRDLLRDLGARADVELRFIGGEDFGLPDIPHTTIRWCAETEVDELRRFDIGLVPLPLTEWNKRKFYVKLIQYMALGIPAVASPLGANPFVIDHERTGFLASSGLEWIDSVTRLVVDRELRESMGRAAALEAHKRYTVAANADQIIAAFQSVRLRPSGYRGLKRETPSSVRGTA